MPLDSRSPSGQPLLAVLVVRCDFGIHCDFMRRDLRGSRRLRQPCPRSGRRNTRHFDSRTVLPSDVCACRTNAGSLAAVGSLAALWAWWSGSGRLWLAGAIFLGLVIPFTVLVIKATNDRLQDLFELK